MKDYSGRELSKRLAECIKKTGLSRKEFAQKCGVPLTTLNGHYNVEDVNFKINSDTLYKYAKALNVSADYLLMGGEAKAAKVDSVITPSDVVTAALTLIKAYGTGIVDFEDSGDDIITSIVIDDIEFGKVLKAVISIMFAEDTLKAINIYEETLNNAIDVSDYEFVETVQKNNIVEMKKRIEK